MTGMEGGPVCVETLGSVVCSPYPEACPGLARRERGAAGGPRVWDPDREARELGREGWEGQ